MLWNRRREFQVEVLRGGVWKPHGAAWLNHSGAVREADGLREQGCVARVQMLVPDRTSDLSYSRVRCVVG